MNITCPAPTVRATRPVDGRLASDDPLQARNRGFALVITLLIVSLLAVIAVSYLTSMSSERQTADAYASKTRAEQAAQAGADAAMAMLTQSFRDFPDSATVWDPKQSLNTGSPQNAAEAAATVVTGNNEGTSLYLRAVAQTTNVNGKAATVANPFPTSATLPPNDPNGNNPNNPACKTFVLPLISGVPGGYAQVASEATGGSTAILPTFNLSEIDPAQQTKSLTQYCTDLNARRFAGDLQGVIGSPADWASGTTKPLGPKPARALWVNVKESDPSKVSGTTDTRRVTGRYAFWTEDESFRANITSLGNNKRTMLGQARIDNTAQPQIGNSPRPLALSDMSLPGFINALQDPAPGDAATTLLATRALYPGEVFPEPLAFVHSAGFGGSPALTTAQIDALRYSSTTQSGTLNFTRHGTPRLNLNKLFKPNASFSPAVSQNAVDQIVETIKYHLPDFGQRFYRSNTASTSAALNARQTDLVANSNLSNIYLYKVAANLCDYLDSDSQSTMILGPNNGVAGGKVENTTITATGTKPLDDEGSDNKYWAQGKDSVPLIQEVVVRYRPVVGTVDSKSPIPARDFWLQVDYYIEFWNMTDRDIYAAPQTGANSKLPNLNNASIFVRDQQPWTGFYYQNMSAGDIFVSNGSTGSGELLPSNGDAPKDWQINLTSNVIGYDTGKNRVPQPQGVVFRAGTVTVVTTDPNCFDNTPASYIYKGVYSQNAPVPDNFGAVSNPPNVFLCQVVSGQREYRGHIKHSLTVEDSGGGMTFSGGYTLGGSIYSGTEISLANSAGYLDIVRGAITKTPPPNYPNPPLYTNSWKNVPPNDTPLKYFNDFSFGGQLLGNVAEGLPGPQAPGSVKNIYETPTPSELGDPRTNNEQLSISINTGISNTPDDTHFMPGTRTLGSPNGVTVKPNVTATGLGWPDYFSMPGADPVSSTPVYTNADYSNAPAVIGDGPLTAIGQLGDVYDPARMIGTHGGATIKTSRGGGRTLKIGQHDDRYSVDSSGNPAPNNATDNLAASNAWASWRLADVFNIDDDQEKPGRININGVARDNGAALLATLDGWNFHPPTTSGLVSDPTIHGDGHSSASPANNLLDTNPNSSYGAAQIVRALKYRFGPPSTAVPNKGSGPLFERGEFGELIANPNYPSDPGSAVPLFGTTDPNSTSTSLISSAVDMNKAFDHGREEMFRRLSELICTRGDTFSVYVVGQSIFQAPFTSAANPPPMKVTGTHRMRVTFRLVPKGSDGKSFAPPDFDSSKTISTQVSQRFAKADHYEAQVLEVNTF